MDHPRRTHEARTTYEAFDEPADLASALPQLQYEQQVDAVRQRAGHLGTPLILKGSLDGVPHGALLMIGGALPCQDLARAGDASGTTGLAGKLSGAFYAFLAHAHTAQHAPLRPGGTRPG